MEQKQQPVAPPDKTKVIMPVAPSDKTKISIDKQPSIRLVAFLDKIHSLSEFFDKDIRHYYKNQKIDRVESFLSWLKQNEKTLLQGLKEDIANGEIEIECKSKPIERELIEAVGFYLGIRYLASRYGSIETFAFPPIKFKIETSYFLKEKPGEGANAATHDQPFRYGINIYEPTSSKLTAIEVFLLGINCGIHEATHSLKYIMGKTEDMTLSLVELETLNRSKRHILKTEENMNLCIEAIKRADEKFEEIRKKEGQNLLSEVATMYTQTTYGLPIGKITISIKGDAIRGVRDFYFNYKKIKKGNSPIELGQLIGTEYGAFMLGPWIKGFYEKKGKVFDVFDFAFSEIPDYLKILSQSFAHEDQKNETVDGKVNNFCKANGINDKELKAKIFELFALLEKKKVTIRLDLFNLGFKGIDTPETVDAFIEAANTVFGRPKVEKLPEGYSAVVPYKSKLKTIERV